MTGLCTVGPPNLRCPRRHHLRTKWRHAKWRHAHAAGGQPRRGVQSCFPEPRAFRTLTLNDDLHDMIVWATTEGGLVKPAAALRGVNKKLRAMVEATHTWHNEWVNAWMEKDVRWKAITTLARRTRRVAMTSIEQKHQGLRG